MSAEGEQPAIRLEAPAELRAGVYSNVAFLNYSVSEFTLNFAVFAEPESEPDPDYAAARLVARVHSADTRLRPAQRDQRHTESI